MPSITVLPTSRLSPARSLKCFLATFIVLAGFSLGLTSPTACAQEVPPVVDPGDLFFQIFYYEKDGIKHLNNADYEQAIDHFSKGLALATKVKQSYPSWRPESIQKRFDNISRLLEKTQAQHRAAQSGDGTTLPLYEVTQSNPPVTKSPQITSLDRQIETLQSQLRQTDRQVSPSSQGNQAILRQKEEQIAQLRAKITTLEKEQKVVLQDGIASRQDARKNKEVIAQLRAENDNLLRDIAETNTAHERKIAEIKAQLQKAQGAQKSALQDAKVTELALALQNQYDSQKSELKYLDREKAALGSSLEALKQEKDQNEDLLEKQTASLAQYKKELEELQRERRLGAEARKQEAQRTELLAAQVQALKNERELLLSRPLRSELDNLEGELRTIAQQKQTLSQALSTNEKKYFEAVDRIGVYQKELEMARKSVQTLQSNMSAERETGTSVIQGLREQLGTMRGSLQETQAALSQEQARVSDLQALLKESKEQYSQLQAQYEDLTGEHALLREMLAGDNLAALKAQNLELQENLNRAKSTLKTLSKEQVTDQNEQLIAKKQYALARTELIKLKHKLELSELRSDKLLTQLQQAQNELELAEARKEELYPSEDVAMLKEIISRQMEIQKRRKLSRDLILEEVKRLGIDDQLFLGALDLAETQEFDLSESQKQLLGLREADDEFRFNDRASPQERQIAQQRLNERITIHESLGREAYQKERYSAAEEFFQTILDEHPGHVPSMMNLGVAKLRKSQHGGADDYEEAVQLFEDAISMRTGTALPFAHLMIGYAHFVQGEYEEAREQFFLCLDQNPLEEKAHLFLAAIAAQSEDSAEAESHLKKALEIEPTLTDPHYNLALLYLRENQLEKARNTYRSAIRKGSAPDLAFEKKLKKAFEKSRP